MRVRKPTNAEQFLLAAIAEVRRVRQAKPEAQVEPAQAAPAPEVAASVAPAPEIAAPQVAAPKVIIRQFPKKMQS